MTKTGYTLKGITAGRGTCDHCGRSLARLFRIATPEGDMVVGRTCAAKMTGYNWSVAQAERIEQMRQAEAAAAVKYGELWSNANRKARDETVSVAASYRAGQAVVALRDGIRGMSEAEAVAFAQRMLEAA